MTRPRGPDDPPRVLGIDPTEYVRRIRIEQECASPALVPGDMVALAPSGKVRKSTDPGDTVIGYVQAVQNDGTVEVSMGTGREKPRWPAANWRAITRTLPADQQGLVHATYVEEADAPPRVPGSSIEEAAIKDKKLYWRSTLCGLTAVNDATGRVDLGAKTDDPVTCLECLGE